MRGFSVRVVLSNLGRQEMIPRLQVQLKDEVARPARDARPAVTAWTSSTLPVAASAPA
jgi:hypothetical protein